MPQLIDRRANGRGKSAVNRERFLRRYKTQVRDAVKKMVGERKLSDIEQGGEVRISRKDISEPSFGFGRGGDRDFVLPGNREYSAGDRIARPDGAGQGAGGDAGGTGESEDAFVFSLSREEFMQIFFDDLELPHLERTVVSQTKRWKNIRAGYTRTGAPANLAIVRTLAQSLGAPHCAGRRPCAGDRRRAGRVRGRRRRRRRRARERAPRRDRAARAAARRAAVSRRP